MFEDILTLEQKQLNLKNKYKAEKYFGIIDDSGKVIKRGYVLHHKDPELRHKDINRYIQWNSEDLELKTRSEHSKLHYDNRLVNSWKGNHHSEESKNKIGNANKIALLGHSPGNKNKFCFTDGKHNIYLDSNEQIPEGYYKGQLDSCHKMTAEIKYKLSLAHKGKSHNHKTNNNRKWYNDGNTSRMFFDNEIPEGFVKGRLKKINEHTMSDDIIINNINEE